MLFLGFGTGLGSAMVAEDPVVPLELGRIAYEKTRYDDHVGSQALRKYGHITWRKHVLFGIERFVDALLPDDVVLGGGNVRELDPLPPNCRWGDNANAFTGGFRMWEGAREHNYRIPTTVIPAGVTKRSTGRPSLPG
jgi:polyphosphate glucokinase